MSRKIIDTITSSDAVVVPTTESLRAAFDAARATHAAAVDGMNAGSRDVSSQRAACEQSKSAFHQAFMDLIADLGDGAPVVYTYASTSHVAASYLNQAAYMVALGSFSWWSENKLNMLVEHVEQWKKAEEAFAAAGYKPVDQKVISDSVGVPGVVSRKFPMAIYDKLLEKLGDGEQPVFFAPAALTKLEEIRTKLRAPAPNADETTD